MYTHIHTYMHEIIGTTVSFLYIRMLHKTFYYNETDSMCTTHHDITWCMQDTINSVFMFAENCPLLKVILKYNLVHLLENGILCWWNIVLKHKIWRSELNVWSQMWHDHIVFIYIKKKETCKIPYVVNVHWIN